jgi:L-threonylcarbamoyladenylate synthase
MPAERVMVSPDAPEAAFARCRAVIAGGGVIAYPTDTFYGLGVDPRNALAVRRLFAVKGRSEHRPILLLIADADDAAAWTATVPVRARALIDRYWPGPLTLVLPAGPDVLPELTGGTGRIGLRVPGSGFTRSLLRYLGTALTGTSANRTGGRDPRSADEVMDALGDRIDLVLDGGTAQAVLSSTVVDAGEDPPRVLRRGAVDISA